MFRRCSGCGEEIRARRRQRFCKECKKTHDVQNARRARNVPRPFIGIDGEGVTREDGTHDYVLLTVGDKTLSNRDGSRLKWDQICAHLYNTFLLDPKANYVGYYLGYDFTQWVRTLPKSRALALYSKEGVARRKRPEKSRNRMPFPVFLGKWSWEIDVLANKRLCLRPGTGKPPGTATNPFEWMYICDVGAFFQQSFEKTLEEWEKTDPTIVTPEEKELIRAGKRARSSAQLSDEMVKYNRLECALLARIMPKLDEGFRAREIKLTRKQWFGPGQAAQAWLRNIGAPKADEVLKSIPKFARQVGRHTYFGGWFEIFCHGFVPGEAWEYDINSAYPSAIARLPCLLHGKWSSTTPFCDIAELPAPGSRTYRALRGDAIGSSPHGGSLTHRHARGRVLRPRETSGWYWEHEVRAAKRAGLLDEFYVREAIEYEGCNCLSPFASIRELYEDRLRVGKNTPRGKSSKLVYNSSYGKMAQSVGHPIFANGIYASLITSDCRTKILEAIATHPNGTNDLLMIATDGIYFRTRHPNLDIDGGRLGAWDETRKQNMTLFMPGLYWDDAARDQVRDQARKDEALKLKSRGVPARDLAGKILAIDELFKRWKPGAAWPSMKLAINFSMVSPKQALDRGKWETCGRISTSDERVISSDPALKRGAAYIKGDVIRTEPKQCSDLLESTPYDRYFGDEMIDEALSEAAETSDGDAMKNVREMLGI